ncbi:hypothetical protein ACSBR1_031154 [Camellia fascicularis]
MFEAIVINKPDFNEYKKCDELMVKILKTFNIRDDAFHIGGRLVKLRKVDIRLVFGLQCGDQHLDLTLGTRPTSNFIQRRCDGVGRITANLIRNLLDDAVKGKSVRDEEDTTKLLCLYFCVKLFFSTSGETISWVFVRYIDNLNTVQTYDWTAAILNTLMRLVREFYRNPEKVTSCVVTLLYWLCEHTDIVATGKPIMFPRFSKWNISTLLGRTRGLELTFVTHFQVMPRRLMSEPYEKVIIVGEDFDNVLDGNVDANGEGGGQDNIGGIGVVVGDGGGEGIISVGDDDNEYVFVVGVGVKLGISGSDDTGHSGSNIGVGVRTEQGTGVTVTHGGNSGPSTHASHVMWEVGDNVKLAAALSEIETL